MADIRLTTGFSTVMGPDQEAITRVLTETIEQIAEDDKSFTRAKIVFTESDERCGLTAELDGVKKEGVPLQLDLEQLEDAQTQPGARAQLEELQASGLGVGVHLNLTLGAPVSSPRRVSSPVDAEGRFIRDAREAAARASTDEARIELGNQIDVFRKIMGRFPTHLDTHHHVGRHDPILD